MSVSHVGGARPLAVVPQQQSSAKSQGSTVELDSALLPEMRKTLPDQAKGAANGLSVQKFFDKWDKDGDGKITTAEAGPRLGHGVLGELLKLQEDGGAAPASSEASTATDTPPPATTGGDDGAAGSADGDTTAGAPPDTTSDPTVTTAGDTPSPDAGSADLLAALTTSPPLGDVTPDGELLPDSTPA